MNSIDKGSISTPNCSEEIELAKLLCKNYIPGKRRTSTIISFFF